MLARDAFAEFLREQGGRHHCGSSITPHAA